MTVQCNGCRLHGAEHPAVFPGAAVVRIRNIDLVRATAQVEAPRLHLPRRADAPAPAVQRLSELRQGRRRIISQIRFRG